MSTHCVSLSPRYDKLLCQYVGTLCVSISTLLQAALPVCRHTVCLHLHVTASSYAICRPYVCLYLQVTASSCANMSNHFLSLFQRYCKHFCQYVDPLCVTFSTLLQATVPVMRHTMCLFFEVAASNFACILTHCVSLSARYCKQFCQYVDLLCVSFSTLLQVSVSVCRPPVCLFPHVPASSFASTSSKCVSLDLHVTASSRANMSTNCVSLSPRYYKQLC